MTNKLCKMFIVYKLTKLSTGETYIGRKTCLPHEFATYWGTSRHPSFYSQRNKRYPRQAESIAIEENTADYTKEVLFRGRPAYAGTVFDSYEIEEQYIRLDKMSAPLNCNGHINGAFCGMLGAPLSQEHKEKLSRAHAGSGNGFYNKKHTEELKARFSSERSGAANSFYGKNHSQESKDKLSKAKRGVSQRTLTCPHCNKVGGASNMTRYHFSNCQQAPAESTYTREFYLEFT